MEPPSTVVHLHLPPLLAACLNVGDCPPMLTGTITNPLAFSLPSLPAAAYSSLHADESHANIASVSIIDHVEREFWGLSFSGHVLALPPSSHELGPQPNCDSLGIFTAVPHGPCIWRRYITPPPPSTSLTPPAVTTHLHHMTSDRTLLLMSLTTTASSAAA
jgi:hypothetical protein